MNLITSKLDGKHIGVVPYKPH